MLIIYKRPELTQRVFRAIADARPPLLLVVADGPAQPSEVEACRAARSVVTRVDWKCVVLTEFAEGNLGAGKRPATGLDWVFSQVDSAIILEDDCLPSPSFFHYCEALLERYRDDTRVMEIGGCNLQFGHRRTSHSYYFSRYPHTLGWATWRRAWSHFDAQLSDWPLLRRGGIMKEWCEDPVERVYWTDIFDRIASGVLTSSWDYQWMFARWRQGGLSAVPEVNMVSHLGYGADATHHKREDLMARLPAEEMWELLHPPTVDRHRAADEFMFETAFGGAKARRLSGRLRSFLSRRRAALRALVAASRTSH